MGTLLWIASFAALVIGWASLGAAAEQRAYEGKESLGLNISALAFFGFAVAGFSHLVAR